jgi:hypothetical protein
MTLKISALEDMSSVRYEGRAEMSEIEDISAMSEDWKTRLAAAIEADKDLSPRGVSLAAGMGAGYIHSILSEGKDPTIGHLMRVCDVVGVSLYYILYGVEMDQEFEEIIRLLNSSSKATREGLLQILRASQAPETAQ